MLRSQRLIAVSMFFVGLAALTCEARAASISNTRSVTLYEQVNTDWEISHTELFRDRVKLAKRTGFNAVWLVVEWDKLDPAPVASGDLPLLDCTLSGNYDKYQCQVERAFAVIKQENIDVFLSLNYIGGAPPASFKNSVKILTLPYNDGPAKLYRHARYVARLVARQGLSSRARFLFHEEGIFAPYSDLHEYPLAQQYFRDYLYAINPNLSYWNSRWSRTGSSSLQSWADVKTFAFCKEVELAPDCNPQGWADPQLQDHVAWANWTLQRTLGSGGFEAAVRAVIPGAKVGIHATHFVFINRNGPATHRPESPTGPYSTFDFVSVPYYDSAENPFGNTFEDYIARASTFAEGRQLLIGELGSQVCPNESECNYSDGGFRWTSPRVERRQAQFLAPAAAYLQSQGIGFNVWSQSEFSTMDPQGEYGIYRWRHQDASTATQPSFKPAGCALRTTFGSIAPEICLIEGAVNNAYSPRAMWLAGRGFGAGTRVRLSNAAGTVFAAEITPVVGSATMLSFQLADQVFVSLGCGSGTVGCEIRAEVLDSATGNASNPVVISVN